MQTRAASWAFVAGVECIGAGGSHLNPSQMIVASSDNTEARWDFSRISSAFFSRAAPGSQSRIDFKSGQPSLRAPIASYNLFPRSEFRSRRFSSAERAFCSAFETSHLLIRFSSCRNSSPCWSNCSTVRCSGQSLLALITVNNFSASASNSAS